MTNDLQVIFWIQRLNGMSLLIVTKIVSKKTCVNIPARQQQKKRIEENTYQDATVGQYGRTMPQKHDKLCPNPTKRGRATAKARDVCNVSFVRISMASEGGTKRRSRVSARERVCALVATKFRHNGNERLRKFVSNFWIAVKAMSKPLGLTIRVDNRNFWTSTGGTSSLCHRPDIDTFTQHSHKSRQRNPTLQKK